MLYIKSNGNSARHLEHQINRDMHEGYVHEDSDGSRDSTGIG